MRSAGVGLSVRTSIQSVEKITEEVALVSAKREVARIGPLTTYRYSVKSEDFWRFVEGRWRVGDRIAPVATSEFSTAVVTAPAATGPAHTLCGLEARGSGRAGPTDYARYLRPMGVIRAAMLFIEFADSPARSSTQEIYDRLIPKAVDWFAEASGGRLSLEVTPLHRWLRRPGFSPNWRYSIDPETLELIGSADVAPYDILYLVGTGAGLDARAVSAPPGEEYVVNGRGIRHVVPLGGDLSSKTDWAVLVHETLHLFGLPDLYRYPRESRDSRYMDGWDIMSSLDARVLTAWNRAKLGWLTETQMPCLVHGERTETFGSLPRTPAQAVAIPISSTRAPWRGASSWPGMQWAVSKVFSSTRWTQPNRQEGARSKWCPSNQT